MQVTVSQENSQVQVQVLALCITYVTFITYIQILSFPVPGNSV